MALGKRKRDDEALSVKSNRHQRFPTFDSCVRSHVYDSKPNSFGATHTAQNARSSPLLRLPAELRSQIWQHAYGNAHIRVNLRSLNKRAEDSHVDLTYTLWEDVPYPLTETLPRFNPPPRVCKQFHSETTAALYATSTFEFTEPHTFRAFALSPHHCVSQMRHLRIPYLRENWGEALTSSLIARLKSLCGVQLIYDYLHCTGTQPIPHAAHPTWKDFWRMIRSFQQHELEAHSTEFRVVIYDIYKVRRPGCGEFNKEEDILKPGEPQYENMLRLRGDLTAGLLQYTPRRLSRRGARDD